MELQRKSAELAAKMQEIEELKAQLAASMLSPAQIAEVKEEVEQGAFGRTASTMEHLCAVCFSSFRQVRLCVDYLTGP